MSWMRRRFRRRRRVRVALGLLSDVQVSSCKGQLQVEPPSSDIACLTQGGNGFVYLAVMN